MDFLKDHEAVQQMLCLMRENGKGEEAEEFLWLIECVDTAVQLGTGRVAGDQETVGADPSPGAGIYEGPGA